MKNSKHFQNDANCNLADPKMLLKPEHSMKKTMPGYSVTEFLKTREKGSSWKQAEEKEMLLLWNKYKNNIFLIGHNANEKTEY